VKRVMTATTYYSDELNDEFSKAKIKTKTISPSYKYLHKGILYCLSSFFWYRLIATPLAFLYCKIMFGHKICGKALLKSYAKSGFFLFGNHTQEIADAFVPSLLVFPKRAYVIVHPNNVSMPVLGRLTPQLGALPIPDDLSAFRNFTNAVEKRILQGHVVAIYPEAHIWPYYTKIRPFKATSFVYPIKFDTPSFCFTNTYQKRWTSSKPRLVTYVDGPFYPNPDLSLATQKQDLRDRIYQTMASRSKENNVKYVKYIKRVNHD